MNSDDTPATAHLRALAAATSDAMITIDVDSRITYANPAIEDVLGYAPADLLGEPLTVLMADDLGRRHNRAIERYLETGERTVDWTQVELPGRHREGHEVQLAVSFGEFTLDGERYFTGVLRDVSESHRRAERLERLNDLAQDLTETETVDAACEAVVAAARDVLDLTVSTVLRYNPDTGDLDPVVRTEAVSDLVGDDPLFAPGCDLPWRAFVATEPHVADDLARTADFDADASPLQSAIVLPLGEHGVFVAGATGAGAFDARTVTLAKILAGNAEATLDRLDREARLRGRTSALETKNEQLRRVQRLNGEIRSITQALMDADSSAEIKDVVCERLADSDPYRFVWFGERDLSSDEVVPAAWAGVEDGYLDAVTITADGSETGLGPAGRAIRTGESQIQNDLGTDSPFEPWRRAAMERGYRASIAVPVTYQDTTYGLLNCYASQPGVFSEMEEAVLVELGEMIGYALTAMERYDALVAEDSVELEFAVRDETDPLLAALDEHDATVRLENVRGRENGTLHVFCAFEGLSIEAIERLADRSVGTEDVTLIRERDGEAIVELSLTTGSAIVALLDRGAVPTAIRATPDGGRVSVRISKSASVREFVDLFEARYADVDLVARRESPDPVQTREAFEREYLDRLTTRQEDVLRTAYVAGFFEQPRDSSARDVADIMDVSQPTVSRHIRAGERKLFSMVFDDPDPA